jgi:hypothetical protein
MNSTSSQTEYFITGKANFKTENGGFTIIFYKLVMIIGLFFLSFIFGYLPVKM